MLREKPVSINFHVPIVNGLYDHHWLSSLILDCIYFTQFWSSYRSFHRRSGIDHLKPALLCLYILFPLVSIMYLYIHNHTQQIKMIEKLAAYNISYVNCTKWTIVEFRDETEWNHQIQLILSKKTAFYKWCHVLNHAKIE